MFAKKALGILNYLRSEYCYDVDAKQLNKRMSKHEYWSTKQLLSQQMKQRRKTFEQYMLRKAQGFTKCDSYEGIESVLRRYLTTDEFETLIKGWYEQLVRESA